MLSLPNDAINEIVDYLAPEDYENLRCVCWDLHFFLDIERDYVIYYQGWDDDKDRYTVEILLIQYCRIDPFGDCVQYKTDIRNRPFDIIMGTIPDAGEMHSGYGVEELVAALPEDFWYCEAMRIYYHGPRQDGSGIKDIHKKYIAGLSGGELKTALGRSRITNQ